MNTKDDARDEAENIGWLKVTPSDKDIEIYLKGFDAGHDFAKRSEKDAMREFWIDALERFVDSDSKVSFSEIVRKLVHERYGEEDDNDKN